MPQVEEAGFSCTSCGRQYRWKAELAGKTVKCKCGSPVKVPRAMGAATPQAAGAARSSAPGNVPPPPPPPPKRAPAKPKDENDVDFDALAALADQASAVASDESNFCPNCRNQMMPEAVLCTSCGFDRRKGKVVAAVTKVEMAEKPKKGMFGIGKPKPVDPKKKKAVDAMAPQGSFFVGLMVSTALALAASVIWFLVAWGVNFDVYYLVLLVGVAAGLGMQIGQKGYSTLGGLAAAGVTLVVMIIARAGVTFAIILPMLAEPPDIEDAPDPNKRLDGREEVADIKVTLMAEAQKQAEFKRKQKEQWDRESAAREAPKPPEDPRVLEHLREKFFRDSKLDPNFSNSDQHQAAFNVAEAWAATMPVEEKNKIIAVMDVRIKKERDRGKLIALKVQEIESQMSEAARNSRAQWQVTHDHATGLVDKMTPEEQAMETVRLEAWAKTQRSAEKKKEEEELAKEEAEEKAEESADASKPAAAGNDGLDEEPSGEPSGAASKPAANGAQPTAVAANGKTVSDGLDEEGDEGDEADNTSPAAVNVGSNTAVGQAAAVTNTDVKKTANSGAGNSDSDSDSGVGAAVALGAGAILLMVLFGGSIWGLFFVIGALFLAYRTASGSVKG